MDKPTVYVDALTRAAIAMGGETRLATALQVPAIEVHRWLKGAAYPSTEIYQNVLDLLISVGRH